MMATKSEFAQKYFNLQPKQAGFLDTYQSGTFYQWERQSGKTTTGLTSLAITALGGGSSAYFAPTFSATKIGFQTFMDLVIPDWAKDFSLESVDFNNQIVSFKGGGSVIFIPATSQKMRGMSFDEIFVDDWRNLDDVDELKRNVFPLVVKKKGKLFGLT